MRFQIKVVFQRSKQPGVVTTNFDDVLGDICAGMLYIADKQPSGMGTNGGALSGLTPSGFPLVIVVGPLGSEVATFRQDTGTPDSVP